MGVRRIANPNVLVDIGLSDLDIENVIDSEDTAWKLAANRLSAFVPMLGIAFPHWFVPLQVNRSE